MAYNLFLSMTLLLPQFLALQTGKGFILKTRWRLNRDKRGPSSMTLLKHFPKGGITLDPPFFSLPTSFKRYADSPR
jgi:hypothetical protein